MQVIIAWSKICRRQSTFQHDWKSKLQPMTMCRFQSSKCWQLGIVIQRFRNCCRWNVFPGKELFSFPVWEQCFLEHNETTWAATRRPHQFFTVHDCSKDPVSALTLGFAFSTVTVVPAGLSWMRLSSSLTIKDSSSIGSKSACSSASSFNGCTMSTPHLPSTAWSTAPFAHFRTMHHKRCCILAPNENATAASSQVDCLVQSTRQMIWKAV